MIYDCDTLTKWEHYLDSLNSNCYVDKKLLLKIFSMHTTNKVLKTKLLNSDNISYLNSNTPFSSRYINDAFIYYNIINSLDCFPYTITDACSGISKVTDIALAFYGFDGNFVKIDYNKNIFNKNAILKHKYSIEYYTFDMVQETANIPKSDIIILNHAIDDLFMGLWSNDTKTNYFDCFNKIEESNKCWKAAIDNSEKYIKILSEFIIRLSKRLNENGYIIIKNYPSGFETQFKQFERINFTYNLTKRLIDVLVNTGLRRIEIKSDLENELKFFDINNMFFIVQNKTKAE